VSNYIFSGVKRAPQETKVGDFFLKIWWIRGATQKTDPNLSIQI
jgi:hypothetical protein